MKIKSATIKDVFPLPIKSASALEVIAPTAYIVGDSSAFIYLVDSTSLTVSKKVPLFDASADLESISRADKPDLEMMCVLPPSGNEPLSLFIAGSGSLSPQRDFAVIVPLHASGELVAESYFLGAIYDALRARADVVGTAGLNLEGCTVVGSQILFFQHGGRERPNVVVSFGLPQFLAALKDEEPVLPAFTVKTFDLPSYNGEKPGFSGAATLFGTKPPQTLFSATVKAAPSVSLIGHIPSILIAGNTAFSSAIVRHPPFMGREGGPYPGRIEGLCVVKEGMTVSGERRVTVAAVTVVDKESGEGEFLTIEVVMGP